MDATVAAGWIGGLAGLVGAAVGALASMGGVMWQQRRTAAEAERAYLLGLAEQAANECIRLSYAIEEMYTQGVGDQRSPAGRLWHEELQRTNRGLEEQSLRFHDPEIRRLLSRCHAEITARAEWVGEPGWPPRYITLCDDIRTVMGTVLRRQPFPSAVWDHYSNPTSSRTSA